MATQRFKMIVPSVSPETVAAAREMVATYGPETNEYKIAAAMIELSDAINLLLADADRTPGVSRET